MLYKATKYMCLNRFLFIFLVLKCGKSLINTYIQTFVIFKLHIINCHKSTNSDTDIVADRNSAIKLNLQD